MSNFRNQFVDALPQNRGQAPSLTARADARGAAAAGGVQGLADLHIPLDHASNRAAYFSREMQRYAADPPVGVGGDPEHHRAYVTMKAQRDGYIAEQPGLQLMQQSFTLSRQPTFAASAAVARTRAIQATLGFSDTFDSERNGTGFRANLNMQHVNDILRQHPELNAANQAVTLKQQNFIGQRQSLHSAAIGFQRVLAANVMGELRRQASTAQDGIDAINARIQRVTALIGGVEGALSAFSGNVSNLTSAAGRIDSALTAIGEGTERRFPGQDADHTGPTSARQRARAEREEAVIQAQPDPHHIGIDHDEQGRGSINLDDVDRHSRLSRFNAAQHQRQRGVNAEHAVAQGERQRGVAASNGAVFREVARAERHGDTPNVAPAEDSPEARQGAAMTPGNPFTRAGGVAESGAAALGLLSSAVDFGMRMYYREELATLTARVHEATSAVSAWQEVSSRLELEELSSRYDAAKTLFEAAANEYQAALDTRRECYQTIGRMADEAGAGGAGHTPSTGNDFNSQAMLYMSSVRETRSMISVAREAANGAQTQGNHAMSAFAHRAEGYDTRDTVWGSPLHEERGPDERVVWDMQRALSGWLREADAAYTSLDDEEASARDVMHENY